MSTDFAVRPSERFDWKKPDDTLDKINVLPETLSAAELDEVWNAVLRAAGIKELMEEVNKIEGGLIGNAGMVPLAAPFASPTPPSEEDVKKILDLPISKFALDSVITTLLAVVQALRMARGGAAELEGAMAVKSETSIYVAAKKIETASVVGAVSTGVQAATQFGISAAAAGMTFSAANKQILNIKDNMRPSIEFKDNVRKNNEALNAVSRPEDQPLLTRPPATPELDAGGGKPLDPSAKVLTPAARAELEKRNIEMTNVANAKDIASARITAELTKTTAVAQALNAMAMTMGSVMRAGGQVEEAKMKADEERSRFASRSAQDASAQAAESKKNDGAQERNGLQQLLDVMTSRLQGLRNIIANLKG